MGARGFCVGIGESASNNGFCRESGSNPTKPDVLTRFLVDAGSFLTFSAMVLMILVNVGQISSTYSASKTRFDGAFS